MSVNKFTPEFRERAVRMVFDRHAAEGGTRSTSIRAVSEALGVGAETLRNWCQRSSLAPTVVSSNSMETPEEQIKRLQRELAEALRANEILRKASAFFAAELETPLRRDDQVH